MLYGFRQDRKITFIPHPLIQHILNLLPTVISDQSVATAVTQPEYPIVLPLHLFKRYREICTYISSLTCRFTRMVVGAAAEVLLDADGLCLGRRSCDLDPSLEGPAPSGSMDYTYLWI